jgi:hypothetical protein
MLGFGEGLNPGMSGGPEIMLKFAATLSATRLQCTRIDCLLRVRIALHIVQNGKYRQLHLLLAKNSSSLPSRVRLAQYDLMILIS